MITLERLGVMDLKVILTFTKSVTLEAEKAFHKMTNLWPKPRQVTYTGKSRTKSEADSACKKPFNLSPRRFALSGLELHGHRPQISMCIVWPWERLYTKFQTNICVTLEILTRKGCLQMDERTIP